MFFRSKNLFLRPLWPEDLTTLRAAICEAVYRRATADFPGPPLLSGGRGQQSRLPRCVVVRPGGQGEQLVGAAGLFARMDVIVLELWIDPAHRRRGYGTEAARSMIEIARAAGHDRICAAATPGDAGPLRMLQKAGFRPCGNNCSRMGANLSLAISLDRLTQPTPPEKHAA